MIRFPVVFAGVLLAVGLTACGSSGGDAALVVNTLADLASPPPDVVSLRWAIAVAPPGAVITFAPALDGGTIALDQLATEHAILKAEVFTFTGSGWNFEGYQERDYGRAALYARKDVGLDASGLPHGLTIAWAGPEASPARVLAVYGDLWLRNVTITGGNAVAAPLDDPAQPFTLARGGGVAVWGTATLTDCTVAANHTAGDETPSRDRGAFGGGLYANVLHLTGCTISGNSVRGFGAAGGGVYSVGGAEEGDQGSTLTRCALSGNRVTAQHAYGGGVYSDGGGPGNGQEIRLTNCTLAANLVEDHPDLAQSGMFQYYYRGGGFYMSNGRLLLEGCTITQNAVTGQPTQFGGKPNMGGGGIAATIGNAHVVENMVLEHSIVVGNTVDGVAQDLFTGSLVHFFSRGHNRLGVLETRYMLVPVPPWLSLSRKHWPKRDDQAEVEMADVLAVAEVERHPGILSVGADAGLGAVRWVPPAGSAVDQIPADLYTVDALLAEYVVREGHVDDFLNHVLLALRTNYAAQLGADFGLSFGDLTGTTFYGPGVEWPTNPENAPWIDFWHALDLEIGDRMGPAILADDFWDDFPSGAVGAHVLLTVTTETSPLVQPLDEDQRGVARPQGGATDIGAIER